MVYLHIPFCDSKCFYCAFNSYTHHNQLITSYMKSLEQQLKFELERFATLPHSLSSVFIGGGTPSCVDATLYTPLFEILSPFLAPHAEITCEANPNSATFQWLKGMKDLGVNRISFGVQSFNDEKLKFLGRAHTKDQALKCVENAKLAGFERINIDIIYGTILDTPQLIKDDLERALTLGIDHLSCYALTIEHGTKFHATPRVAANDEPLGKLVASTLIDNGFEHYEISNFGKNRCRHNLSYWEGKDYIGGGSGAVGFLKDRRFYPTKDLEKYIKNPLLCDEEALSPLDLKTETVLLALRSCVGFDTNILSENEKKRVSLLAEEKKVTLADNKVYPNDFFLADEIALFLLD